MGEWYLILPRGRSKSSCHLFLRIFNSFNIACELGKTKHYGKIAEKIIFNGGLDYA